MKKPFTIIFAITIVVLLSIISIPSTKKYAPQVYKSISKKVEYVTSSEIEKQIIDAQRVYDYRMNLKLNYKGTSKVYYDFLKERQEQAYDKLCFLRSQIRFNRLDLFLFTFYQKSRITSPANLRNNKREIIGKIQTDEYVMAGSLSDDNYVEVRSYPAFELLGFVHTSLLKKLYKGKNYF